MRNIDYVLELLVAVKFMSSVLRSVVVWYLLLNNSINKVPRETHDTPRNPRMTPAFSRSYSVEW